MRKLGEESEHETRKKRIDAKLRAAGWKILPFEPGRPLSSSNACAIEEYPTSNGPADYALVLGGRILGIVEAKKLSIGPKNVLTQAERYSKGVDGSGFNFRGYRVPFLYSTNGEVLWHHDIRHPMNCSREIALFHTPAALEELISRDFDSCCDWFAICRARSSLFIVGTEHRFDPKPSRVSSDPVLTGARSSCSIS